MMRSQQKLQGTFSDTPNGEVQSEEGSPKELTTETGITPEAFKKCMEGDSSVLPMDEKLEDYDYSDRYTPPKRRKYVENS
jgi:hypothetical protein